jgi:hypothetical protein
MIKRRPRIRTTTEEVLSNLYHLERNKIIGEADDLVQSKDPNAVISANTASGSSPRDVDVFTSMERMPCEVRGDAHVDGVLRLHQTFTS